MSDDGVIKFTCHWDLAPALATAAVQELARWRDRIFDLGLIGVYPDGVGYGNISLGAGPRSFLISGTQTGHLPATTPEHYTLVNDWNIPQNTLQCRGPVQASSESLTHAALYEYSPSIQAVIHGHHAGLWQRHLHRLPTTAATVPYGTPAMAQEMWRLFEQSDLMAHQMLIMAGHEDGLIAFGGTLESAARALRALAPGPPAAR